uniref:Uncharacterized protein n=1 Tax=Anguilla anguilla TaxID=7936 RepID=A0A0E9QUE2_ANGAN
MRGCARLSSCVHCDVKPCGPNWNSINLIFSSVGLNVKISYSLKGLSKII